MVSFCIPNNLKKYRKIAGYSQNDIALMLGFSYPSNISKWEKGLSQPSIEHLIILSQLYNSLPNELYSFLWQTSKKTVAKKKLLLDPKEKTKSIDRFYL